MQFNFVFSDTQACSPTIENRSWKTVFRHVPINRHIVSSQLRLMSSKTYGTIFNTFSPLRLFTPVDSNQNVQSQLAASVLLYVASLLMRLT